MAQRRVGMTQVECGKMDTGRADDCCSPAAVRISHLGVRKGPGSGAWTGEWGRSRPSGSQLRGTPYAQLVFWGGRGGADGTRTRDPRRDRPVF